MTENHNHTDLLALMLTSLTAQSALANQAHALIGLDGQSQNQESCSSPAELSRQAGELALSARETAANTASAHNARGRQLDYLHAQSGGLVLLTERYMTQVRQRRDILQQTQRSAAIAYTDVDAGLQAESAAHQLAAYVDVLESFILAVRAVAHQSVSVVTREMATH